MSLGQFPNPAFFRLTQQPVVIAGKGFLTSYQREIQMAPPIFKKTLQQGQPLDAQELLWNMRQTNKAQEIALGRLAERLEAVENRLNLQI